MIANAPDLKGWHIYHDKKGNTVYWDVTRKKAWILTKEDVKGWNFFSNRIIASICIAAILIILGQFKWGIICGVLFALASTFVFFRFWLPGHDVSAKFSPSDKKGPLTDTIEEKPANTFLFTTILLIFAAVLSWVSIQNGSVSPVNSTGYVVLIVLCVCLAVVSLYCFVQKKRG